MNIGVITCVHMLRTYGYQRPDPFDWAAMEKAYHENYTAEDFLQLAKEIYDTGLEHLDLWEPMFSHKFHTPEEAADLAKRLHEMGFKTISYCIGGWYKGDSVQVGPAYRFANALGAKVMLGAIIEEAIPELFPEMEKYGKEFGIKFGVENHPDPCIGDPEHIRDAIAPYETIGVNIDAGLFHGFGYDLIDAYEMLKERVVHVHLKDNKRGARGPLAVGQGDAPMAELLRRLKRDNYQGMISIECSANGNPTAAIARSIGFVDGVYAE